MRARAAGPEDAADLTQQVFLQALDALASYRGDGRFAAWLFRIARLRRLFAQLDAGTREMLILRFAARLGIADIARITGKSEAATQKKLYRAIQALKKRYLYPAVGHLRVLPSFLGFSVS